jgi:putative transposase
MSKRRASTLVGIPWSTLHYQLKPKNDEELRTRLKQLADQHRRYGSPLLHKLLKKEGLVKNHKRTERIYREEKLSIRRKNRRKRSKEARIPMKAATKVNQNWSMDFIVDRFRDSRKLKGFTLIDDFNRESLAIEIDHSIGGKRVAQILDRIVAVKGKPEIIRSDNGPEFTSMAMFEWAQDNGVLLYFIEPGKPMQNALIESFHSRFRDDFLNQNWFGTLKEAREAAAIWQKHYNEARTHSSLGDMTPLEFAAYAQKTKTFSLTTTDTE